MHTLAITLLAAATIVSVSEPLQAAEGDKASPAPIADGDRPLAGSKTPGKAATEAVTDPSTVPPSERAPGAGTKPAPSGETSPDAKR